MQADMARRHKGKTSYLAGEAAEQSVARLYCEVGKEHVATRWRCPAGEIDLIFRDGDALIFVEVKKSQSFRSAALRISDTQKRRLFAAGEAFMAGETKGLLTPARFDVALVDATGRIEVLENALIDG